MYLTYRQDLQGLRAVAVLLVILNHAEIWPFSGGFVGVDVFFVLSGYLISGILISEHNHTGRISLLPFYARRLRRLLPALVVMLGVSAAAAAWLLSADEAHTILASAPYAASWTSNLHFAFRTYGYFDDVAARDLFLHTWSLGVEEQFYLAWPLLLGALLVGGNVGERARGLERFFVPLTCVVLVGLAACVLWTWTNANQAFYLTPARIWQFGLGAAIYVIGSSRRASPLARPGAVATNVEFDRCFPNAVRLAGLAAILVSAILFDNKIAYPGAWAIVPSVGAALVIVAGDLPVAERPESVLSDIRLVWIGDRSYSIYLWHWPVLVLGSALGFGADAVYKAGLLLLVLLLSIISYRMVELPFWKGALRRSSPRTAMFGSAFVVAIALSGSVELLRNLGKEVQLQSRDVAKEIRLDVPVIYRMPCDAWYHHSRVEPCVFEVPESRRTVVILGDSIGAQWFSAFQEIYPLPEWRTIVFTKSSCAIVDAEYVYQRIGKEYTVCTEWRNKVLDELERIQPDVVVVGSDARAPLTSGQWVEGSARTFARLARLADTVFVLAGTPSLTFDAPSCIARELTDRGTLPRDRCSEQARADGASTVANYLNEASIRLPNVRVLNLNNHVCPDGVCRALSENGVPVFRDSQHLTNSFVKSLVPSIRLMVAEIH